MTGELTGDEVNTLEDMVYDRFHEATQRGPAVYDTEEFIELYSVAESVEPVSIPEVDRSSGVAGVAFLDNHDKAAYGFVDYRGDEVELDLKCFGDRAGVVNYVEKLPSNGYTEGVDGVSGQAWSQAAVEVDGHPLDVKTDSDLPEPGETPEEGFTNSQAERIR